MERPTHDSPTGFHFATQTARDAAHAALLPPFDEADALERMGGEVEILLHVVDALRESQAQLFSRIEAALAEGNLAAAGGHAHALKGALLAVSAAPGATLAAAIEGAARSQNPAPYAQWLEMLRLELTRLDWALSELVERHAHLER